MMNCIIVDDEPMATEGLISYIREISFLQLVDTCENPLELIDLLSKHTVDLVFLDIHMPKMTGIDFLKSIQNPPLFIIVSAYPSYALEGFQLNVLDYLVKPVMFDRFFKAAVKAKDYHRLINMANNHIEKPAIQEDYIFIKCGNKYERVMLSDILYIEGLQNYVNIYTYKGKFITLQHLKSWCDNLDEKHFIRIHKSYIIAKAKVDKIEGNTVQIGSDVIPIGRSYREQVLGDLLSKKLIR